MDEISAIRTKIDSLDSQILSLISERTELARMLMTIKQAKGLATLDKAREQEILDRADKIKGLSSTEAEEILKLLLKISKKEDL